MSNQTSTSQQMKSFLSGKTYLLLIIIIFNGLLVQQTFAQPTITSFTPADGPVGTEVTITGTHFSSIAANNIVYFGAVKSTVIAATATTLKVNVPTGTTYQPITVTTKGLTAYSSKPFLVTFASVAGPFTDSSFSANIDFETGISPLDNHLSDFNGDGKPDVIVSDYNAPTVTILKNLSTNGNVTFDSVVNLKTSGNATTCFIGDFDGDGKQDVGATGYFTNSISVFRNQSSVGNISFGSKTDFATSVGPSYSAIGDLDKDGKPDIVITARGSERISILRNTSTTANISFASKLDFTIGANSEPFACAMGDLDGDGKVDIIVGNRGVGYISLFRNTSTPGHISLASRVDINISEDKTPNGISIGDLNGDGEPDIVVAGFGNNFAPAWISILQNKSIIGSLLFEKHIDFFTGGAGCHSASITDLDGDGKPDLVTDNYWDGILSVLKNTSTSGHLSFDKPVFLKANSGPNHPQISDLDGDQKPDIEVANIFSHSVSAFRNLIKFKRSSLVSSFTLVNANTDKDIQAIPDGSVLDKTALPPLNIRANTTATKVGSVVFILDGQKVRTENGFP
ncbi:FG-GAP-like repeat-containing protein, partial [Segetibacter koreensis]|uniref:FG-GAP-like repeat-containing protein n=1 Tax=Segetibacter koreensis TaxID=398037 RepID=UPI001B7FAFA6